MYPKNGNYCIQLYPKLQKCVSHVYPSFSLHGFHVSHVYPKVPSVYPVCIPKTKNVYPALTWIHIISNSAVPPPPPSDPSVEDDASTTLSCSTEGPGCSTPGTRVWLCVLNSARPVLAGGVQSQGPHTKPRSLLGRPPCNPPTPTCDRAPRV